MEVNFAYPWLAWFHHQGEIAETWVFTLSATNAVSFLTESDKPLMTLYRLINPAFRGCPPGRHH
jgi:hypothetical protein